MGVDCAPPRGATGSTGPPDPARFISSLATCVAPGIYIYSVTDWGNHAEQMLEALCSDPRQ